MGTKPGFFEKGLGGLNGGHQQVHVAQRGAHWGRRHGDGDLGAEAAYDKIFGGERERRRLEAVDAAKRRRPTDAAANVVPMPSTNPRMAISVDSPAVGPPEDRLML
jgi:hypothetical protein